MILVGAEADGPIDRFPLDVTTKTEMGALSFRRHTNRFLARLVAADLYRFVIGQRDISIAEAVCTQQGKRARS